MSHRILVVEDEPMIRMLLVDTLSDHGMTVAEAANSDEALALVGAEPPFNLLITDVRITGAMDGVALAHHVRTMLPDVAVLFMTGGQFERAPLGVRDAFLAKPFSTETMLGAVDSLLGNAAPTPT